MGWNARVDLAEWTREKRKLQETEKDITIEELERM
jgi:hypothetical protein